MACVAMEMQASQQSKNTTMRTSTGTMSHANMPMGDVTKAQVQSAQYEGNTP